MRDAYAFGIEEEYFLSNATTRQTPKRTLRTFEEQLRRQLPDAVHSEMLQSQIEVVTPPLLDMAAAEERLAGYRRLLAATAAEHDLLVFASGTHPVARWDMQRQSPKPRYNHVMHELQMVGSRNILCGLHVHVGIPESVSRIDIMRRMTPYLPVFLALSTSSPYWQSRRTGLMGYRLAAYDELPRTGIPDLFRDDADYRNYVDALLHAGAIPDESYIWWAIRPSAKYPTLELRIADSCTDVSHTIAIAALYRCLVRHLTNNPLLNAEVGARDRAIALENKWIAQRHGIHGAFIDLGRRRQCSLAEIVEELVAMVTADALALGCLAELHKVRSIFRDGTSADRQIMLATEALGRGRANEDALCDVVDWLAAMTRGERSLAMRTLH
ncbi:MAG: carboxylate-amine ligase [Beijerinckiaceae bacterium]